MAFEAPNQGQKANPAVSTFLVKTGSQPSHLIEITSRHNIPLIWTNTRLEHDCVYPDDIKAGYEATRHLLELGHKRIAFAQYDWQSPQSHYSEADRLQGYLQAMKEFKCQPKLAGKGRVFSCNEMVDYSIEWLRQPDYPTAVVAYSTMEATAIAQAATEIRCSIPTDLSLVTFSFGDITEQTSQQTYFWLAPTMGSVAAQMIIQKIADPSTPLPACALPAHFIAGRTTAPPRKQQSSGGTNRKL